MPLNFTVLPISNKNISWLYSRLALDLHYIVWSQTSLILIKKDLRLKDRMHWAACWACHESAYFIIFVFFSYTTEGISGWPRLLAFHLSGTPSLTTGTRPPSCIHLHNRLYMQYMVITYRQRMVYRWIKSIDEYMIGNDRQNNIIFTTLSLYHEKELF